MSIRFALALIVTLLAAFPALASPSCMTKHEARAYYGSSWIYWHGPSHCWDNQRGRRVHVARHASVPMPVSRPGIASSVWPAPPTDFTWADRWPDERRMVPGRWLFDLRQFGGGK